MDSVEQKVLDYLEGKLEGEALDEFRRQLKTDPRTKELVTQYQSLFELEGSIASEQYEPRARVAYKVMEAVERDSLRFFRRFSEMMTSIIIIKRSAIPVSGLALACLAFVFVTKHLSKETTATFSSTASAIDRAGDGYTSSLPSSRTESDKDAYRHLVQGLNKEKAVRQAAEPSATDSGMPQAVQMHEPKEEAEARYDDLAVAGRPKGDAEPGTKSGGIAEEKLRAESLRGQAVRNGIAVEKFAAGTAKKPAAGLVESEQVGYDLAVMPPPQPRPTPSVAPGVPNEPYGRIMPTPMAPRVSGEVYGQWEENPRQLTALEPLSTFSVDVDTGSYTNARRFLRMGTFPPKHSVRIEEYINYFDYNYPSQSSDPFTVHYEVAPSPLDSARFLLKLGIKAKDVAEGNDKPWNLVFLIDVSGSMRSQDKLPLLQQSFSELVHNMRPQDRVAIVTYAGWTGVALESTPGTERDTILARINSLRAGGRTHGSAGITRAYEIAQQHFVEGGVNRIILATDGDFNVGTTNFSSLVQLVEQKRKSGVSLTTLGFGTGNINEKNMEQLANKGNGNYFYIDSFKEARKVFGKELASTVETVAKDVKLQVEFNPEQVIEHRLIGYDNRKLRHQDFNNDTIDAGEIGSGHTVTAIYELVLAGTPMAEQLKTSLRYQRSESKKVAVPEDLKQELGFVKIRFKQPDSNRSTLRDFPLARSAVKSDVSQASEDFRFAAAVAYLGQILRESQFLGDYTVADVINLAKASLGADTNGYRREFVELVENARSSLRQERR